MRSRGSSSASSNFRKFKKGRPKNLARTPFWVPSNCATAEQIASWKRLNKAAARTASQRGPSSTATQTASWQVGYPTISKVNIPSSAVQTNKMPGAKYQPSKTEVESDYRKVMEFATGSSVPRKEYPGEHMRGNNDIVPDDKDKGQEGEDWVWVYDDVEIDKTKSPKKDASFKASSTKPVSLRKDSRNPKKSEKMNSILRSRRGKRRHKKGALSPPKPRSPAAGISFKSEAESPRFMTGRDTGAGIYHHYSMNPLDDRIRRIILDDDPELSNYFSQIKELDGIDIIIKEYETTKSKGTAKPLPLVVSDNGKSSDAKDSPVEGSDHKSKTMLPDGTEDTPVDK